MLSGSMIRAGEAMEMKTDQVSSQAELPSGSLNIQPTHLAPRFNLLPGMKSINTLFRYLLPLQHNTFSEIY